MGREPTPLPPMPAEVEAQAACRGLDLGVFFDRDRVGEAQEVCNLCAVKAACGEFAEQARIGCGVWGGQPMWPDLLGKHRRAAARAAAGLPARERKRATTALLRVEQVVWARHQAAAGWTAAELAVKLGVHVNTVRNALTGETWRDAGGPLKAKQWRRRGRAVA